MLLQTPRKSWNSIPRICLVVCTVIVFALISNVAVCRAVETTRSDKANQLFNEAEALRTRWQKAQFEEAVKKYTAARVLFRIARNTEMEARTLNAMGRTLTILARYPEAVSSYFSSIKLYRAIQKREGEAEAYNGLASVFLLQGQYHEAIKYSKLVLDYNLSDPSIKSEALNGLAEAHYFLADFDEAIRLMKEMESLPDESNARNKARIASRLGGIYIDQGQYERAFESLNRGLSLWRQLNNRQEEASTLGTLGSQYAFVGQYQTSLDRFNEALSIYREIGDRKGEADQLLKIGYTYLCLGGFDSAIAYYSQGADIYRDLANRYREGTTLGDIGDVHMLRGNAGAALDNYQRALRLVRSAGDRQFEAFVLYGIGRSYSIQGKRITSLDAYNQALPLFRQLGNQRWEANTLTAIAAEYVAAGDVVRARSALDQSLKLSRGAADLSGEALTLYYLSLIHSKQGDLDKAKAELESVIRINDTLRSSVLSPQSRISYLASVHQYYESYVDLLMEMHARNPAGGFEIKAFEASERARARSLTEMMREAQTDIRHGVDSQLLARESTVQQELNSRTQEEIVLLTAEKRSPGVMENLQKEIQLLTTQLQQVQAQIRAVSPRYAAMSTPAPLTFRDVQEMLDPDTLLLEFDLGSERSFGWVVSPTFVRTFKLPARAQIESLARDVYLGYSVNDAPNPEHAAEELSKLLFGDIAPILENKRLVIVADGFLQHISFAMLPQVTAGNKRLIENHELVTLPAASVLALQRSRFSDRTVTPPAVAIFADPVFDNNDVRTSRAKVSKPAAATRATRRELSHGAAAEPSPVKRALRDVGFDRGRVSIPRLPFSRSEADSIRAVVSQKESLEALDFNASLTTLRRTDLSKYRFIHFATHGLLNSDYPELSGILLSMVDEKGKPVDGFLQLNEIYNLKLAADLVVLSACQTALGKDVKGEGLIGLTRGFMHAGARRVVGGLWKVDDAATAALMENFYKEMFINGKRPAAALREAQISLSKQKRWQSPYYWAGFVLQGDWR
jgi:CHAT domain-containing protein/tetratricopeptide (TPR) repeat protein